MSFNIKSQYSAILSVLIIVTMYFKDSVIHMDTLFYVLKPIFIIVALLGIIILSLFTLMYSYVKEIPSVKDVSEKFNKSKYNLFYVAIETATFIMSVVTGEKFIGTLVLIRFIVVQIFKNIVIVPLIKKGETDENN